MAFCPHCGKSVTEQAAKCAACNGELEPRGKAARFKGTMMMSPGTAPLIQPPNAGQPRNTAPAAQPAASASVPSGTAATMPMPAAGPIADAAAAAAAAAKKPAALKATMLGTGDGGLSNILKKVQQPAKKVQQPAPAPAAAAAVAPPAPAHTPLPTPMPPSEPAPAREPAAATRREVQADEDSKRFLVGDPMAPKGGSEAPIAAPKAQRNVPRISEDMSTELPKDRSATIIVVGIIGVCVIAAIGYVAAKLMGLTN